LVAVVHESLLSGDLGDLGDEDFAVPRGTGPSILVVDDNPRNLLAFVAVLETLGRPIVTAQSGTAALQRLLEEDFALILMDVQMPGIDGYETTRLIRSRPRTRLTPIIFITAFDADQKATMRAYQLGAVDFLTKPVHEDVLRAKASVFLDLDAHARALRAAHERELQSKLTEQQQRLETALLREQNQRLAEADRRKDQMLAMLAHELRNPLAPIVTALDLIDEPEEDSPIRPRAILRRSVSQLSRLVDDLLDISRFAAGKIQIAPDLVSLTAVVEDALDSAMPLIEARHHEVLKEPPGQPVIVEGDALRLVQVVANLINNSAKYTPDGGHITLSWGRDGDRAFVRVRDNGRGIPDELLGRIWEPFVQERVGADGTGGMGLGLALVHKLVQLHRGEVRATSDGPGKGSMFEVRLPLGSRT
jgi:signal transduction histidine kinase